MTKPSAAVKLCECGCGQPTQIAKQDDPRNGYVKGRGVQFLKGHNHRGKVVSEETRNKLRANRLGEDNHGWKGDDATYRSIHSYLCSHYTKSGICDECGRRTKHTQYALIHGRTYTRNRGDYRELCSPCHVRYDLGGKSKLNGKRSEILKKIAQGRTYKSIAADYGVSRSLIGKFLRTGSE